MSRPASVPDTHVTKLIVRGLRDSPAIETQNELAEHCGLDESHMVKLMSGKIRYPRPEILLRLAATLNQEIDDYRVPLLADSGELPD